MGERNTRITDFESVPIPKVLYRKIEKRLGKTEFKSVGEYIAYVLEQVLIQLSEDDSDKGSEERKENVFSEKDQENVQQRLRDLGYL